MPDTTIIKLSAPALTGLTATTAHTDSQLNTLTTATVAGITYRAVNLTADHIHIGFWCSKGILNDAFKGAFNNIQ